MGEHNGLAVIWDVDGTLVDTAELHYQAWLRLTRELNLPFSRSEFAATFGQRNPEIIPKLVGPNLSDREIAELGHRKEEYYRDAAQHGVSLLPGVRRLLEDLRTAGFKQAVGSSAPRANLELILRLTDTEQFFTGVVSMEDTQRGKPDPQVFLVAAEKLTTAPANCLVLEDVPAGVQAAHAGGMTCIAVRFVGHLSEQTLREAGADRIVETLEQVSVETVREVLCRLN